MVARLSSHMKHFTMSASALLQCENLSNFASRKYDYRNLIRRNFG
jgi:hypothetical protein